MCGIFALFEKNTRMSDLKSETELINDVLLKLQHRGPDSSGEYTKTFDEMKVTMVHTRLMINGNSSPQPIYNSDKTIVLIINGEIFNWKELQEELNYKCQQSDCEIIIPLYEKYSQNLLQAKSIDRCSEETNSLNEMFNKLKGQFSFVLFDNKTNNVLVGRDPIGVTPLYISHSKSESNNIIKCMISSEMKTMINEPNTIINIFHPRHYFYGDVNTLITDFKFSNYLNFYNLHGNPKKNDDILTPMVMDNIKEKLTESVRSQLEDLIIGKNEIEFGVLLSGGLDSSLIASLVVKEAKKMGYTKKIKTFSVGVNKNVPDLIAARKVSKYLDTDHYEYYFSPKEGIIELEKVIWFIESYDCTTVRASTAMYFLTRGIKTQFPNLKVVFSGELSDELLCYLYGANAPNSYEFQMETINLINNVHKFDCLRANKTCMANSIEARVPFTDIDFVNTILGLDPELKMFGKNGRMEKQILRDSFRDNYLPNEILYRKKEQFSDGVSGFNGKNDNWIDAVKDYVENLYTLEDFDRLRKKYKINKPDTKEKLFYREIFSNLFCLAKNNVENTVEEWLPKWSNTKDPSGREQKFWTIN
jgi:asparagine synthase (glutamine-hydrolysing)